MSALIRRRSQVQRQDRKARRQRRQSARRRRKDQRTSSLFALRSLPFALRCSCSLLFAPFPLYFFLFSFYFFFTFYFVIASAISRYLTKRIGEFHLPRRFALHIEQRWVRNKYGYTLRARCRHIQPVSAVQEFHSARRILRC